MSKADASQTLSRREALAWTCAAVSLLAPGLATPVRAQGAGKKSKRSGAPLIPGGNSRAPVTIDAEKLDYFEKEQKLIYSGNVIAKQGEATLRTPRLTIFLEKNAQGAKGAKPAGGDDDNNNIRRMEADGPVRITSKEQVGTGDRGVYDKPANKVLLIGNPVLTQGINVVRGGPQGTLEYDLNTGRAHIKGGRVQSIFSRGADTPAKPGAKEKQ